VIPTNAVKIKAAKTANVAFDNNKTKFNAAVAAKDAYKAAVAELSE